MLCKSASASVSVSVSSAGLSTSAAAITAIPATVRVTEGDNCRE